MVDIYVVTILVALVHLGNLATIEARAGAVFFGAVVVTTMFAAMTFDDADRWDAGMIPNCIAPDEPVYIYSVTLTTDGNDYPILHFQDPNQPSQVTGFNVYRTSDAGQPPAQWPQVASDVVDMDEAEPNNQWVDTSGDVSPTGIWYYDLAAYNHRCPEEGPR